MARTEYGLQMYSLRDITKDSMRMALEKVAAVEPTRGRPEKPEPSRPVTAATAASQRMTGPLDRGTFWA